MFWDQVSGLYDLFEDLYNKKVYPECKECVGPHLFGFNKKSHVIQIVAFLSASAVVAGICTLF